MEKMIKSGPAEKKSELDCPNCKSPMQKSFSTISGNSKYLTWECDVCGHKEMKCVGVLK